MACLAIMCVESKNNLFEAVRSGDLRRIRFALSQGAEAGAGNASGQTAVMLAASMGRADIAHLLLDRGAPIDAKDQMERRL